MGSTITDSPQRLLYKSSRLLYHIFRMGRPESCKIKAGILPFHPMENGENTEVAYQYSPAGYNHQYIPQEKSVYPIYGGNKIRT
jgi:hypothetical protein